MLAHGFAKASVRSVFNCGDEVLRKAIPTRQRARVSSFTNDKNADNSLSLPELLEKLDAAIDDEEYETAASIRDEIQRRREDNRLAVEDANNQFYDAFRAGDYVSMSKIWGSGEHVQCIHPAAECIAGRQDVLASWKLILNSSGRLRIALEDVRIYASDTEGFVTAVEVVDAEDSQGRIVATNIFEKQNGVWKIVHHHGGPVARL